MELPKLQAKNILNERNKIKSLRTKSENCVCSSFRRIFFGKLRKYWETGTHSAWKHEVSLSERYLFPSVENAHLQTVWCVKILFWKFFLWAAKNLVFIEASRLSDLKLNLFVRTYQLEINMRTAVVFAVLVVLAISSSSSF